MPTRKVSKHTLIHCGIGMTRGFKYWHCFKCGEVFDPLPSSAAKHSSEGKMPEETPVLSAVTWARCQWCGRDVCLNPSDPNARLAVWNHFCLGKLAEISKQMQSMALAPAAKHGTGAEEIALREPELHAVPGGEEKAVRKPGKWTPTLDRAAKLGIGKAMMVECDEKFSATRLRAMLHISRRTNIWKWTLRKIPTRGNWWLLQKVGLW